MAFIQTSDTLTTESDLNPASIADSTSAALNRAQTHQDINQDLKALARAQSLPRNPNVTAHNQPTTAAYQAPPADGGPRHPQPQGQTGPN